MKRFTNKTSGSRGSARKALNKAALIATLSTVAAMAFGAGTADARLIANPSPPDFYGNITGGYLQIYGSNNTILGLSLDFQNIGLPYPSLRGTVDSAGNVNFPQNQISFAPIPVPLGTDTVNVAIQPVAAWTGKLNPLTGRVDLLAKFRVQATGSAQGFSLGGSCFIGSSSNPITLNLSTHLGTAPTATTLRSVDIWPVSGTTLGGPYSAQGYADEAGLWPGGPAYDLLPDKDRAAGTTRMVDDTTTVPAGSGCGPLSQADGPLNSQLGLPTQPGKSRAVIDFGFVAGGSRTGTNAIVNKGVNSKFYAPGLSTTAWPATEIPEIPTSVPLSLDGSGSVFYAGANSGGRYQWDLGTGTFGPWTDTATQTTSFSTTGLKSIRLTARDADGDVTTKTHVVNVVQSSDISVATSAPEFRGGSNGAYTFTVTNNSTERANTQPITLSAPVPAGTTFVSAAGTGWTCNSASGGTLTCTRPTGTLAAGASSAVTMTVAVSPSAEASVANSVSVAQTGDPNADNNAASGSTTVRKTDLAVTETPNGSFTANGVWGYNIGVHNAGDAPTVGNSTVVVALPEGMTFRASGSGGTGWSCSAVGGTNNVSCVYSGTIAAGEDAPALTVVGRIANSVSGDVTSSATVSAQGDTNAFGGADSASSTTSVAVVADLAVYGSHTGAFTVGSTGSLSFRVDNESVVDTAGPTALQFSLPAGLTVSSISGGEGWDCSATSSGSASVDCSYTGGLVAGASTSSVEVTVAIGHGAYPSAAIAPAITNAADGYATNNTGADSVSVSRIDVSLTQSVDRSFSVGVEGVYRIAVKNGGTAATVGSTTVHANLPSGIKFRSASGIGWDCSASKPQELSCTRDSSLAAGEDAGGLTLRVDVLDKAGDDGQVDLTTSVSTARDNGDVAGDAPVSGNNVSTLSTKAVAVDLNITTRHAIDFVVGTPQNVVIKVRNVGTFPTVKGQPVTVTDTLPEGFTPDITGVYTNRAGWSCTAEGRVVTCVLTPADSETSALGVGSTAALEIPVTAGDSAANDSTNSVEVSTLKDSSPDRSPNNISTDSIHVNRVDIDLNASQSVAPRAGGIAEVTANVLNSGSSATVGPIQVTIPLAAGTSYRAAGSVTTGWDCSSAGAGTSVVCERAASLPVGASTSTLKIRENVTPAAADAWTTEVTAATATEAEAYQDDNSVTLSPSLEKVNLELVKSHAGDSVKAGHRATFRYRVTNVGNVTSGGVIRITDTISSVFTGLKASGSGWTCSIDGHQLECTTSAAVAAGARTPDVTLGVNVPTEATGIYESSALATLANAGDPYPANDTSADPAQIVTTEDLALSASFVGSPRIGGTFAIRYRVRNVGAEIATGNPTARITDNLPDGLVPVGYVSDDAWECDLAGGNVECDLSQEIEPGGASYVTVRVRVDGGVAAQSASLATVAAGSVTQDPNRSNDHAVQIYNVTGADLAIAAELAPNNTFKTGKATKFLITVSNIGSATTTGPTSVTIPLTKGETFADNGAYGTNWDCRLVGEEIHCDYPNSLTAGETSSQLQVSLTAGEANLPSISSSFTAVTDGDANSENNTITRTDDVTDLTPEPDTNITDGPAISTTSRSGRFTFESSDEDATFQCRLDGAAWATCRSPLSVSGLAVGPHSLEIRSIGHTGKIESEPASFIWTIRSGSGGVRTPIVATMSSGEIRIPGLGEGGLPLPAGQLSLTGDVGEDGSIAIPATGIKFPVIEQAIDAAGISANAKIIITSSAGGAGRLTPGGGDADFAFPAKIKLEAALAGGLVLLGPSSACYLQPINFNLRGHYDHDAGTISLSQEGITLPKTSPGCGGIGGTIDGALGLPRSDVGISVNFNIGGGVKVGIAKPQSGASAVTVPVACKGISAGCGGKVEVVGTVGKKSVVFGRSIYRLRSGKGATVKVPLSRDARTRISKAGRKGMRVTVRVLADGSSSIQSQRSIILRK